MDSGIDNIKKLFNDLKTFTLWDRLFHWGRIRTLLIETSADLQKLVSEVNALQADNLKLEGSIERINEDKINFQKEISVLKEKNDNYLKRGTELANEKEAFKSKVDLLDRECGRLREEILQLKAKEEQRRTEYDKAVNQLFKLREDILKERSDKEEKEKQAVYERLRRLKETWSKHEADVKNRIKIICNKHGVEYLESVPFKGKPDNTLKINDEFIVFDAKSPGSDDLSNFPLYLRNQAESVSKYVKEENVRREVFLVVPTNTLDVVEQFEYKLSDYTVYVISIDALEPIILSLRKIEDYEFAEQLSPEERENICRVIGKFVHLSKRRIQIDGFFAKQFFELVYRSEADLPKDFLDKVIEFEKAEKLNPPIERRARQISNKELEIEIRERKTDAEQKGIEMDEALLTKNLNKLPLYTDKSTEDIQKDLFE
ncbi:MAG: hypothetical protein KF725_16395 [Cyclobacteriaceae bacterium]|nr:hypothetical protein [Cyclobacteriaceae bacterium]UYN87172.1 MAG: hypothetical protein KIT51_02530 [Cyclobacteriaceae bacterium]